MPKSNSLLFSVKNENYDYIAKYLNYSTADLETKDNSGRTPLHIAAAIGDENIIRLLLDHNANIEARDNFNRTVLQTAVQCKKSKNVQLLISSGANIEARGKDDLTPLQDSVMDTDPICLIKGDKSLDIIKVLLKNGADVNAKITYEKSGYTFTLLHYLSSNFCTKSDQVEIAQLLLNYKANLEEVDSTLNYTPLYRAAFNKKHDLARLFLCNGAKIQEKSNTIDYEGINKFLKEINCNTTTPTIESFTKMISNDPTVKTAMELRNTTSSTRNSTISYQNSEQINSSHPPKITDQGNESANTNIGTIIGVAISGTIFVALSFKVLLGWWKRSSDRRNHSTYNRENLRNEAIELLPDQANTSIPAQDNTPETVSSEVTVCDVENTQRIATTSL